MIDYVVHNQSLKCKNLNQQPQTFMKFLSLLRLLCISGLLLTCVNAFSQNEIGVDLRYECKGSDQYRIIVTRYIVCDTTPIDSPDIWLEGMCPSPTLPGTWATSHIVEVTPICPLIPNSCVQPSPPPSAIGGVKEYVQYLDVDFSGISPACEFWIVFDGCCRSSDMTNGAADADLYVRTGPIDLLFCNHSPNFLFPPTVYILDSTIAHASLGADDPDGDSLSFHFVDCLDTANAPITYLSGYSLTQPMGPNWEVSLDPLTGNLTFLPAPGGEVQAPVCVEVKEYRDGMLLSTYMRDMSFEVVNPTKVHPLTGELPYLVPPQVTDSVWGGGWVDSFTVRAAIGEQLRFELQVMDNDGDKSTVTWTDNLPQLGAEFYDDSDPTKTNIVSGIDPVAEFQWIPKVSGRHAFGVRLIDSTWCGLTALTDYAITIDVADTSLLAVFPEDTIYICPGDSLVLSPTIYGIPASGPFSYAWNTNATGTSIKVGLPGTYSVLVVDSTLRDPFHRESKDSVVVAYADFCVWPGDADNDGTANNFDVLAIGLAYGETGPARQDQSLTWSGKQASAWGDTILGGVDYTYANTNGDTIINVDDTLGISLNYANTHFKTSRSGGPGDPPLWLQTPNFAVLTGDTLSIPILLGTDSLPADSVYGVAFSITYDSELVDSGSAHITVGNSWLGTPGTDLFSMQKDQFQDGRINIGISRDDHTFRGNHGEIARLDIIMIDDITGKRQIFDTLYLEVVDLRVIRTDGTEIPIYPVDGRIIITNDNVGIPPTLPTNTMMLYPNPNKGQLLVQVENVYELDLVLYDLQGRPVMTHKAHTGKNTLSLTHLTPGIYLLKASNGQGILTKKIQLIR